MKIDIAELPNIMQVLQKLTDARRLVAAVEAIDSDVRLDPCITADDGQSLIPFAVECDIGKDELLAVYRARVDSRVKHLAQTYQIDFARANVNAAPVQRVDVTNTDDGPTTAPTYGEPLSGGEAYAQ